MKILITTDLYITASNGVSTSVRNLCDGLEKKGHDVRVITLSEKLKSYKDGNVYYIKSVSLNAVYPNVRAAVSYRNSLIRELIDWKPDVIHSQCEFFSFQFAKRVSKLTGAPIVHTYHTLYEQYAAYVVPFKRLGNYAVRFLSRKRLRRVSTIIVPTRKVEDILLGYGIQKPIFVVPSGIALDQHFYRIGASERTSRRREIGIQDRSYVLINLGRLGTEKNVGELLELFADAVLKNDRLSFLIVGDGPDKARLEQMAVDLKIADRVFFAGMAAPSEVQKYYQLGDVFISASTSETQGLTYVEAAANGLPLLCRKDPCLKDVIENGVNGYEYAAPDEFQSRLDEMLNDELWLAEARKRSEKIAERFDKKKFADNVENVYRSVL